MSLSRDGALWHVTCGSCDIEEEVRMQLKVVRSSCVTWTKCIAECRLCGRRHVSYAVVCPDKGPVVTK